MSFRVLVAEGPVRRVDWFYTPHGDGHESLTDLARQARMAGLPVESVQHVVEYVGPWLPVEERA